MKYISVFRAASILLLVSLLGGCAMAPAGPESTGEPFVLERDLVGSAVATGSFSAIDGTHREFTIDINGNWDGKALTLVEDFIFDDGVEERKTWVFTSLGNGEWSGTREDVIGTARGWQDGDIFRLEYDMALPDEAGNPGRKMRFQDVIYNDEQGDVVNKATVGLWGVRVATVSLTIRRPDGNVDDDATALSSR